MADWLPSLNALRAFAAVCRHKTYAHAAEELRVTPAAVKQLVRKLEIAVGQPLVQRRGRGLAITAAGRAGMEGINTGFDHIGKAVERMRRHNDRQRLIVSVEPSFATAWLVPRLDRFRQHHADIDVLIDSSLQLVDLSKGETDAAIRFAAEITAPLIAYRLFDERLCAFCSPALAHSPRPLRHLRDLEDATLIHWDMSEMNWATATRKWMGWQTWLKMAGAGTVTPKSGLKFNDYNLALQSAIAGHGVVLGSLPILRTLVETGLLLNPFPEIVDTNVGYDLVTTAQALERPEVRHFVDWIRNEANVRQNDHQLIS